MSKPSPLVRKLGAFALRGLIFVVRWLPLRVVLWLGGAVGTLIRWLSKKRYRVALANLDYAYGETLSQNEKKRIAKECFCNLGRVGLEGMKFAYISQQEFLKRTDIDGIERAEEAFADGKGVIGISAHLGPFELGARLMAEQGHESTVLMREARDPGTTAIMIDLRKRNGLGVISLKQSLRPMMSALSRNAFIGIACDQNASDVVVPFFGKPTGTVDGPARIILRTGSPLLFLFTSRMPGGRYRILIDGPFRYASTGDQERDVAAIMTEVNRRIEDAIRRSPEQWFWFHNRWRSSPKPDA